MNKNILLIGEGQIGSAIKRIEENANNNVFAIELGKPLPPKVLYEVCHVCIPYSEEFTFIIGDYMGIYKPVITIIHSTVKPNTTKELITLTGKEVVYSPCMGVHPNLYTSLLTFTKLVGGDKDYKVSKHLRGIGIDTYNIDNPTETEIGKLLSTSYYLHNIYFMNKVKHLCDEQNLEFDNVYGVVNEIYNDGYEKLGCSRFIRPILTYSGEGIGGHCLIPNAIILDESEMMQDLTRKWLSLGSLNTPNYKDKTWLYCEYIGKDKSISEISRELNICRTTTRKWIKKHNIPKKDDIRWSDDEKELLEELSKEMIFKDIVKHGLINRTYKSVLRQACICKIKSPHNINKQLSDETKVKISCSKRGIDMENFISFSCTENQLLRNSIEYKNWRDSIFKRDGYTCQNVNCIYCQNKKGGILHGHHIKSWKDYKKLRFDINNGITYCEDYHIKDAHTNTEKFLGGKDDKTKTAETKRT